MTDAFSNARYLIVNADDFGFSDGVNGGILAAHEKGIVTSTSLMVRWPTARDAVARANAFPKLSLGLHVDMGEWTCRNDQWEPLYAVLVGEAASSPPAVAEEVDRQLDQFVALVGRVPTHLDSHQHVHRSPPLREVMLDRAERHRIPLRHFDPVIHYLGSFYGQAARGGAYPEGVSVPTLMRLLEGLAPGVTELGCHPALFTDHESPYRTEREVELESLCDPAIRKMIATSGITLTSFAEVAQLRDGSAR